MRVQSPQGWPGHDETFTASPHRHRPAHHLDVGGRVRHHAPSARHARNCGRSIYSALADASWLRLCTDGWDIAAGHSAIAEVYPSLWRCGFAPEGHTGDQHGAFCIATWF